MNYHPNVDTDLRFTSYVINNLLFLTPDRHLLYVTDAVILEHSLQPSHTFEHLACFFPGLLALGVDLLPLDRLDTLGIDVAVLADDLFPADRQAYADLFQFNLADLHLWAAEGIAQTCYLMYADQPSGLGPESAKMNVDPHGGEKRWMDEMRAWKKDNGDSWGWWRGLGSKYIPPGVRDVEPWTDSSHNNQTVEPSMMRPTQGQHEGLNTTKDYLVDNPAYYLRPEVRNMFLWCAYARTFGCVDG